MGTSYEYVIIKIWLSSEVNYKVAFLLLNSDGAHIMLAAQHAIIGPFSDILWWEVKMNINKVCE